MLDKDILNILRNRWVILGLFIVLSPIALEIHREMVKANLADWPLTLTWLFTGLLGLYLGLHCWEDES